MNLNKFSKLWYVLLLLPLVFVTSCGDDDTPDPKGNDPIASFQFAVSETNFLEVTFSNFSQNATSYAWDFGDGVGTSTAESPVYAYTAAGDYSVKLTATNADGVSVEKTESLTITDPGIAGLLLSGSVSKTWKLFREGTSMQLGTVDNPGAHWPGLTNDGSRNCLYEQTFTFHSDGTYVFDDNGLFWGEFGVFNDTDFFEVCFDAVAENMLNKDGADVSAWLSGTHQYTYDASTGAVTLTGMGAWIGIPKLGPDAESVVPLASTSFEISITEETGYDLMNLVFTHGGNIWSFVYASYSDPSLEPSLVSLGAAFDVSSDGLTATFTDQSFGATSYDWDFGDGNSSTDQNPVHIYASEGTYDVMLTVGDGTGTTDSETRSVVIVTSIPAPSTMGHTFVDAAGADLLSLIGGASTITLGVDDPENAENAKVGQLDRIAGSSFQEAIITMDPQQNFSLENVNTISLDVYIPSSNDFTGSLQNYVVIGLADQTETPPNWWEDHGQWEVSDLATDQWHTLTYDLTAPATGGNTGDLTLRNDLDMIFIGFGGGNHGDAGTCYIRNLKVDLLE